MDEAVFLSFLHGIEGLIGPAPLGVFLVCSLCVYYCYHRSGVLFHVNKCISFLLSSC